MVTFVFTNIELYSTVLILVTTELSVGRLSNVSPLGNSHQELSISRDNQLGVSEDQKLDVTILTRLPS